MEWAGGFDNLVCVDTAAADVTGDGSFFITRLNAGEPIITEAMFSK